MKSSPTSCQDGRVVCLEQLSIDGIRNGVFNDPKLVGRGYRLINVVNLYGGSTIDTSSLMRVDIGGDEFSRAKAAAGDLFFTRSSLKLEGIAKCNINVEEADDITFDCHVMRVRPKKTEVLPEYLAAYCSSPPARRYFMEHAQQTTMTTISQGVLGNLPVFLPPLPEQHRIAQILSCWDRAIEKVDTMIGKVAQEKAGLMSRLLSLAANRHYPKRQLGEFLIPTSYPVPKPERSYYALSVRSHGKGTFSRYVEDPKSVAMDTLFSVKPNELIVNITFAWEGAVAIVNLEDEGKLVSHRFPTYRFNEKVVSREFFRHVIRTKRLVFYMGLISPGGAGRNRVLNQKDLLSLEWPLPPVEKQVEVAHILNAIEKQRLLLERYKNILRTQKQGLMARLFAGESTGVAA